MRAFISLLLVATACASTPAKRDREDGTPSGIARRPFTAEQIRDAHPEGRMFRFRIHTPPEPAIVERTTFVDTNERGATIETVTEGADGKPAEKPKRHDTTWGALMDHASFPADATTIQEKEHETGLGRYDCWVYTVTSTDEQGREVLKRYYFGKKLPGPPIQFETWINGNRVSNATMIERR